MKRCSFRAWIPILPLPVWPLAWQCSLGQNTVVGSMTLLLAVRGNMATRSMSGPPFSLQLHRTTVWCGATQRICELRIREKTAKSVILHDFLRIAILVARIACDHSMVWNGPCDHSSELVNSIFPFAIETLPKLNFREVL